MGDLSPIDQLRTVAMQNRVEARFGDILIAHGMIDRRRLYAALARQYDTQVADFEKAPADIRLIDMIGVERCLREGLLPWMRRDRETLIATSRPEQFAQLRNWLEEIFGPVRMVIAAEVDLHAAVLTKHPRALAARAETRVRTQDSCRDWATRLFPKLASAFGLALLSCLLAFPVQTFAAILAWAVLTLLAGSVFKTAAAISQFRADRIASPEPPAPSPIMSRLPTVSLLVPLYKEREIAKALISRLSRIDYPRELLDICLIVEADDKVTSQALQNIRLPDHIRQIVVPDSKLKTKPRALNYALDFCRGSIIGVYDAEDAPARDQIHKVVRQFHSSPPEVACLQGILDFYNTRTNWLSRCFTIEYAAWFRVMLPGLARLGFVIPLGGTTLFFRREALERLGGWDAHNVTEDADLGLRLARRGYRTDLIDTVTEEEANCRLWPWIKQRSRWLKGYAMTWAVHMRAPRKLWRDLGPKRFIGVQLLFLGTISQFLLAPLLWSFWLIPAGIWHPINGLVAPALLWTVTVLFLLSETISMAINAYAVRSQRHRFLMPWIVSMYLYFPLAAVASYRGVFELLARPFYWDKTAHGIFTPTEKSQASAPVTELRQPHSRRA